MITNFQDKKCWSIQCINDLDCGGGRYFIKGNNYRIKDKFPSMYLEDEYNYEIVSEHGHLITIPQFILEEHFIALEKG